MLGTGSLAVSRHVTVRPWNGSAALASDPRRGTAGRLHTALTTCKEQRLPKTNGSVMHKSSIC